MLVRANSPATYRIIAHRCLGFDAPENSEDAFDKALRSNVDEVEIDVRLTKDQRFVLCHDPFYRGTDGVIRQVSRTTLKQARSVGLLPLETALSRFAAAGSTKRIAIDVKVRSELDQLVSLIRKLDLCNRVVIISWDQATLKRIHQIEPIIELSFSFRYGFLCWSYVPCLPWPRLPEIVRQAKIPLRSVNIVRTLFPISKSFVRKLDERGIELLVVNANSVSENRRLYSLGVSGTLTNNSQRLLSHFRPA